METADPPLTDKEIQEWVDGLGPTDHKRLTVIREMLHYNRKDKMSPEDETICRQELERLKIVVGIPPRISRQ